MEYRPDRSPVFILSKGRQSYERGTVALLVQDDVPFTLVVEKEEYHEYKLLVQKLYERAQLLKQTWPDRCILAGEPTGTWGGPAHPKPESYEGTDGEDVMLCGLSASCTRSESSSKKSVDCLLVEESPDEPLPRCASTRAEPLGSCERHTALSQTNADAGAAVTVERNADESAGAARQSSSQSPPCDGGQKALAPAVGMMAETSEPAGTTGGGEGGDSSTAKVTKSFVLDPFILRLLQGKQKPVPQQVVVPSYMQIICLPESDRGVSYVRNYILRTLAPAVVKESGGWYWVMDDDIKSFSKAENSKNVPISPREMFTEVSTRIKRLNASAELYESAIGPVNKIAIFSLEYARYAFFASESDMTANSYNNIACLFRHDMIPATAEYRFRIREDYDFTLQMVRAGLGTLRFRSLAYDVPVMARNKGGLTEYYKTQREDIRAQNNLFVETWPCIAVEWVKGKGEYTRDDIRVRWDLINPRKVRTIPSADEEPRAKRSHKKKPSVALSIDGTPVAEVSPAEFLLKNIPLPDGMKQQRRPAPLMVDSTEGQAPVVPTTAEASKLSNSDPLEGTTVWSELAEPCERATAAATVGPDSRRFCPRLDDNPMAVPQSVEAMPVPPAFPHFQQMLAAQFSTVASDDSPPMPTAASTVKKVSKPAAQLLPVKSTRKRTRGRRMRKREEDEDGESCEDSSSETYNVIVDLSTSDESRMEGGGDLSDDDVECFVVNAPQPPLKGKENAITKQGRPRRVARKAPCATVPRPKPPPGWFGYVLETWREMTEERIKASGLRLIECNQVKLGRIVAVVPERISVVPSVLIGVVIDRTGPSEWNVVPKVRGAPMLSVRQCFEVPEDMESVIARIDAMMAS